MTNTDAHSSARPPEVFSPRVAIALFLVGVFSFSAFVTLSTFAPDLMSGNDAGAHALSRSAIGFAGAVRLARADGASVTVSRTAPRIDAAAPLVILTPKDKITLAEVDKLADHRALIILPKWIPVPNFQHPGWVSQAIPQAEDSVAGILEEITKKAKIVRAKATSAPLMKFDGIESEELDVKGTLRPGQMRDLQTITGDNLVPVVTTEDGRIVVARRSAQSNPEIYILADPDLLNTQGLADIDTARAGMALLDALRKHGAITFDVTLHGFERSRSLLRLAFEPPLLAATLSLLAAAALLAWRAATRSGPAAARRRAIALGKRTLADNSAALIRLARREHTMSRRYAALIGTVAAERIGVWHGETDETVENLDRIGKARGVKLKFSDLAAEASAAQTGADAVNAARKLHSWNEEILRATR